MSRISKKKSPLEKLVEIQQNQTLPVKVIPKNRLDEPITRVVTPIIEDEKLILPIITPADVLQGKNFVVSNSSLVVNLNLNVDSKAVDKAFEKSAEMAKKIAAAGAAMLGTALIFSANNKEASKLKISHPRVNLKPKVKVPKFKKK